MKKANRFEISITDLCEEEGLTVDQLISMYIGEEVVPALCREGCQVEPDGRCEHNCPSILLGLGVV